MNSKPKFLKWIDRNFKLSILEIAICGIFIALWIVSNKFISINLGFMRAGIVYVWVILIGLIFKPLVALTIAIIGDNLALLTSGGFGYWMIEYAAIFPSMALLASFLKHFLRTQNLKLWTIFVIGMMIIMIGGSALISALYQGFEKKSANAEAEFLFNSWSAYAIIWSMMTFLVGIFIYLLVKYFKTRDEHLKILISVLTIVSFVIIIYVWLWGPIAQIRYLAMHFGKDYHQLFNNYDIYFVPRVLKTPILIPLYTTIITAVYRAYNLMNLKIHGTWTED